MTLATSLNIFSKHMFYVLHLYTIDGTERIVLTGARVHCVSKACPRTYQTAFAVGPSRKEPCKDKSRPN